MVVKKVRKLRRRSSTGVLLAAVALSLVLSFMLMNTSVSMWLEDLDINASVSVGSADVRIKCYKVMSRCCCCCCFCIGNCSAQLVNGKVLNVVVGRIHDGSRVWIGLLLKNKGTLPAWVKGVEVNYYCGDVDIYNSLNVTAYFYGPFKFPGSISVWALINSFRDCCHNLPFPHHVNPPVRVEPGERVIVWIKLYVNSTSNLHGQLGVSVRPLTCIADP
ncbi:MAG: hypothetical protein DRJ62_07915 [Thermoprotei archaeon]|nr:MAG: hypothetical protein DRJ62_07915 [Thermoprotei archaeon]